MVNRLIGLYEIQKEVERILIHSQNYPFNLNASNLIKQWKEAKKHFIDMFGGKTFIRSEEPIKVNISEEQRSRRFSDFMEILKDNEVLTDDLETFLWVNKNGFFDNKVEIPFIEKHIPSGAKISKSIKKFLVDEDKVRWIQDTTSRFIQESKIEGYLYLSVDPRDFLTLSENGERWWSCHSLDGDYRAGNLSYMVDKGTMIAYIANETPKNFRGLPYNFKWNSKKWRMLLNFSDNSKVVYFNRQYPFSSETLIGIIHNRLKDLFPQLKNNCLHNIGVRKVIVNDEERTLEFNNLYINRELISTTKVVDYIDNLGYNDLVFSYAYLPIVSYPVDTCVIEDFRIKIGEKPVCPNCGKGYLEFTNSFLCNDCIAEKDASEDFYDACFNCRRRLYSLDEAIYEPKDLGWYCKSCYNVLFKEDD